MLVSSLEALCASPSWRSDRDCLLLYQYILKKYTERIMRTRIMHMEAGLRGLDLLLIDSCDVTAAVICMLG